MHVQPNEVTEAVGLEQPAGQVHLHHLINVSCIK
jgi:hypothetical protein